MAEYIEREAKCRDCIHAEVCLAQYGKSLERWVELEGCKRYKNKADVVEVVRCKDCKYFKEYTNEYKRNVENADGDCYLRVMYSDNYQFDAVKYCDYCSMGAKMDGKGEGE